MPSSNEKGTDEPGGDQPGTDDVRERFRAALDRKHAREQAGHGDAGPDPSGPAHLGSGPAKAKRTFRRKSG